MTHFSLVILLLIFTLSESGLASTSQFEITPHGSRHPTLQDLTDILNSQHSSEYQRRVINESLSISSLSQATAPQLKLAVPGLQKESPVQTYTECKQDNCTTWERKFLYQLGQIEWNYKRGPIHQIQIIFVEFVVQSEIVFKTHPHHNSGSPQIKKHSVRLVGHRFL